MQEALGPKGLTILAITSEPKSATETFVRDTGARYGYAYDPSGSLMRALGLSAYPSSVLVDPSGTVVWKGHPAQLTEELVTPHLAGAIARPVWEWPKETARARKALQKGEYAKALAELAKLEGEGLAEIRASVEAIVTRRLDALEAALREGDFLGVSERAPELKAAVDGIVAAERRVGAVLQALKADEDARRVMKLQQAVRALRAKRLNTADDARKVVAELEALAAKAAGTYAAREAEAYAAELRARLKR